MASLDYEKSSHNCRRSEKLRLMPSQNKIPWLGTMPSFVLSALRAVVVFVERKQTALKQKRENENRDKDLITYILNFHANGAFQTLLRASKWSDLPVLQNK